MKTQALAGHAYLVLLWLGFFILHSIMATRSIKRLGEGFLAGKKLSYRLIYNLVSVIILAAVLVYQRALSSPDIMPANTPMQIAGLIALMIALFIAFSSLTLVQALEFGGFVGVPGGQEDLRADRAYGLVRHPLFVAGIFAFWGFWLVTPQLKQLVTAIITTGYFIAGAYIEERRLVSIMGERYENYKAEVPMFIPKLRWHPRQGT